MFVEAIGQRIRKSTGDLSLLHGEEKNNLNELDVIILRRTNTPKYELISMIDVLIMCGWVTVIAGGFLL